MKPIKIDVKNAAAITDALKEVNGRATSFTLTTFSEVQDFADAAEAQLAVLPKSDRIGAGAQCVPAGPSANAYKHAAKSTRICIERRSTGWFLNLVFEDTVYPKSSAVCRVTITAAQRDEIQRRSVADFVVNE